VAFHPDVMVCPPGRVKLSDQPLTGVLEVLVIVMLSVSPLFHALTVVATRQPPGTGEVDGLVGGVDGLVGGVDGLVGGVDGLVGGVEAGVVGGVEVLSRPRKEMAYASWPDIGNWCPTPAMLMPSTVARVLAVP